MKAIFLILAAMSAIGTMMVFSKLFTGITKRTKQIIGCILFVLCIVFFWVGLSLKTVPAQASGVLVTPKGVIEREYSTGWYLEKPWHTMYRMDKTTQVYTCAQRKDYDKNDHKVYKANATQSSEIWAPTTDGIKMGFDISISWRIDPEYAWWIYDNISETDDPYGGRFLWLEENIIKAKLKSCLALTVSQFSPTAVYSTARDTIQMITIARIREDVKEYHLIVDGVDIREVYYDPLYEKEINQKKIEEQKVLTKKEITKQLDEELIQAERKRDIVIKAAEGKSKEIELMGEALRKNPNMIELEWINKWNGVRPTYEMSQGTGTNIYIPAGK